jgi:tetratricopeptide (TPR) repeat protein
VLNIAPTATENEVKRAILRDRRLWSNRTNTPDLEHKQDAEHMVALLAKAEQILLDSTKRLQYDLALRTVPINQSQAKREKTGGQHNWVCEGWRFLRNGDIPNALYAATQAARTDGTNPEAWALSAQAKFRWGQIIDAIYEYKRAINLRPNEAQYYFDLGGVYESAEDWVNALQQYQWAARVEPMSTMYRASVGEMYFYLDRHEEAIATLKQCVVEVPDNRIYKEFLALTYCADSYKHWTYLQENNPAGLPEGHYAITKLQVDKALAFVQKAQALELQTPEVRDLIHSIHVRIQAMLNRHFHDNWFAAGFATFLGFILFLGSPIWGLLYLICGVGYAFSCFIPQYLINRRIIGSRALAANNFWMNIFLEGEGGWTGMVIGFFVILLTLPVVTVINIIRNWVLAPRPTAIEKQQSALLQTTQR